MQEEVHGFFPTGDRGRADWVGNLDAGFSERQPGGWIFNILPYLERNSLREIERSPNVTSKRASPAEVA
jgi:hypothetical protein